MSYFACQSKLDPSFFLEHLGWHLFATSKTADGTQEKRFTVAIGQTSYSVEVRPLTVKPSPWELVCKTQSRDGAILLYNGLG